MAVTASSDQQLLLLEIADLDTKLIQLKHQRAALPEVKRVQDLEIELGSVDLKIVAAQTEVFDLESAQEKAETDVEQVEQRIAKDQARLAGGSASPKELESLQHELATLAKRLNELEDVELEVMQQLDDAKSAFEELTHNRNRISGELDQTNQELSTKLAEFDAELTAQESQRATLTEQLPKDLVDLYEKIKTDQGDVGAAKLHRGACQGCHISLDATELNRIKGLPAETVVRCEECRRILVRTAESGL